VTTVTAQTLYKSCGEGHGKERLKRNALWRPRKTDIEGVDVTCWDRLSAATGKAWSLTRYSCVWQLSTVDKYTSIHLC